MTPKKCEEREKTTRKMFDNENLSNGNLLFFSNWKYRLVCEREFLCVP